MPLNLIPPPASRLLRWFSAHKQAAADYFSAMRQLSRTVVTFTVDGVPHRAIITYTGNNAEINMALGTGGTGVTTATYPALIAPPLPGKVLRWILRNKKAAGDYVRALFQLSRLELCVTVNGVPRRSVVTYTGRNAELRLNLGTF